MCFQVLIVSFLIDLRLGSEYLFEEMVTSLVLVCILDPRK